jgi:hypothetical protein
MNFLYSVIALLLAMANPRRSKNLWNDQRRTRLTHTSRELFWIVSPTGPFCRTIGGDVFGGSLEGKVCVGYVAFALLAHSGWLLCVWGQCGSDIDHCVSYPLNEDGPSRVRWAVLRVGSPPADEGD